MTTTTEAPASQIAEPTVGGLPSTAPIVATEHPLRAVTFHSHTWNRWKENWERPDLSFKDRLALLNTGYDAEWQDNYKEGRHERVRHYLALATGQHTQDQFTVRNASGYRLSDPHDLSLKTELAKRAFQLLCTKIFNAELITYKYYSQQDWPWSWFFDDQLTVEYLIRFLLAEGNCGRTSEHPYDIFNKFIEAIREILFQDPYRITYICREKEDKKRREAHVKMMRPRLLPLFLDRGEGMYFCGPGAEVMHQDHHCRRVMREYIFARNYHLPSVNPKQPAYEREFRKAKTLDEAIIGESTSTNRISRAAIAYSVLLVQKKNQLKVDRMRKAQADLEDAQRRLLKVK
jgi:hypothetical protein